MKTQLILLHYPIIVSDEKIKIGDTVWEDVEMASDEIFEVIEINPTTGIGRDDIGTPFVIDSCKKIIAQSDQIDWNGLDFGKSEEKVIDIEVEMESVPDSIVVEGFHAVNPRIIDGKIKIWKRL